MPESESDLIDRCRAADAAAWDTLFDLHYGAVGRFIFQFSPDLTAEDVEDLSQEVFLNAVRSVRSFAGRSAIRTWLFRIAVNKTRDLLERRAAAKRGGGRQPISLEQPNAERGLTLDPPSPAPGPDQQLWAHEEGVRLRTALDTLGDPCREVLELRYFGDLSYEEIARELGITLKAAGSRIHKCLGRLAALMGVPRSSPSGKPASRDSVQS
jgi:RNA polymerase sigma-70 factor (ECF subfamily)